MIPSTTTITQVDELPGEEIEFSIGDPRWVMRTQADLYSNRELAVVREYSTNGADANLERALSLGVKPEPLEVTLPSALDPYFVVRDYGDGMSRDILAEVYTKFGTSTKRDSDDFNGMLGYGSKSAVAYTNTFTVTSINNGTKTIAVVNRKPDWSIVMKVVSQVRSSEPSGTEIRVPVHNPEEFAQKARDFYKFWRPGTVLVNGKEPQHHAGRKIVDGIYAAKDYGNSYVVMGNVPYRIENPAALFAGRKMRHFHFVAYVNNGDVEFTPSREALKYTQQTKDALLKIMDDMEHSIVSAAKDEIANAKDHVEAFKIWTDWRNNVGVGLFDDLTYKGDKLEGSVPVYGYRRTFSSWSRGSNYVRDLDVMAFPETLIVTNFFINDTAETKRKAKQYADLKGWTVSAVIFTSKSPDDIVSKWIDREKIVAWDDLRAALPKKQRQQPQSSGRPAGSWDYYRSDSYHMEIGKPIPAKGKLFYVTVQESKRHKHPTDVLKAMGYTDTYVIRVPQNRLDKFKRDYPKIENLSTHAESKIVKDGVSLLSQDAKDALSVGHATEQFIARADLTRVDDPEFARLKTLRAQRDKLTKEYDKNIALANSLGVGYSVKKYDTHYSDYLNNNYPLIQMGWRNDPITDDQYLYMNAKYKVLADRKNND